VKNSHVPASAKPIRILLTDTDRRPYAARIAIGLADLGCEVSIVSTRKHPIEKTSILRRRFNYSAFRPLESLSRAIRSYKPELIVPCDDRAVQHLHELHQLASKSAEEWDTELAQVIERSIGTASAFPVVSSRWQLLQVARSEGLRLPPSQLLASLNDLKEWKNTQPFPWILKTDGTWGGRGIRLTRTYEEAEQQFRELNRPCGFKRAMKRLLVNRDAFYVAEWRQKNVPSITAQRFIAGRPANCAVVCSKGEVLAGISVEVVTADGLTGPASVVRVIQNAEMMFAARRIAQKLKLSGFFGLDFILEDRSGAAFLIEMNPRSTPLCHLRMGKNQDMLGALVSKLRGADAREESAVTDNDVIAYFPQAWGTANELLRSSFQDYPHSEPRLAEELLRPWPERTLVRRMFTYFSSSPSLGTVLPETQRISFSVESTNREAHDQLKMNQDLTDGCRIQ
jgi:carbamoylphosphate synthase large subunit